MPKIDEAKLKKQISSGDFSPVYLIYGDEQMYVKSYTQKLCDAVTGKARDEFNFRTFAGEIDLFELDAATSVISFFGERNCVLVEDPFIDAWKSDEPKSYFLDIISRVGGSTVLVISMPSYKPKEKSAYFEKLIKAVEKHGSVCNFKTLGSAALEKHISKWASQQGKIFPRVAINRLIRICGKDLHRLKNETEKLCAYSKGEEITIADIDAVAIPNVELRVFDLSNAILRDNPTRAYEILENLFYRRESCVAILAVLSNTYIDIYRLKLGLESGAKVSNVAADFGYGKRAFVLDDLVYTARGTRTETLQKSLDLLLELDTRLKSEKINDRLALEQLTAQLLALVREGGHD